MCQCIRLSGIHGKFIIPSPFFSVLLVTALLPGRAGVSTFFIRLILFKKYYGNYF
jgi:hypothetical protein